MHSVGSRTISRKLSNRFQVSCIVFHGFICLMSFGFFFYTLLLMIKSYRIFFQVNFVASRKFDGNPSADCYWCYVLRIINPACLVIDEIILTFILTHNSRVTKLCSLVRLVRDFVG
jgi:hypothetical protein